MYVYVRACKVCVCMCVFVKCICMCVFVECVYVRVCGVCDFCTHN